MQSTLISRESDPHDAFVVEPDVVLAARADHAPPDPISSLLTPPAHPAPELAARPAPELAARPAPELAARPAPELATRPAPPPVPPVDTASRAPANNDIQIPRDIHVSGQRPPRGKWAGRVTIGFLFALGSAAAAEGWNHYGDTAGDTVKAVVANWTPFTLAAQRTAATSTAAQPAAPVAAADQTSAQPAPTAQPAPAAQPAQDTTSQASAQPAPAAQPAQDTTSQGSASQDPALQGAVSQGTASTVTASTAAAPDQAQSLQSMAQDVASMGQQIAALKASIEQLKASQDQMAQQMSREVAKTPVARTSQAKPPPPVSLEQSLRAKVTAAFSPRSAAPPPRKPRPVSAPQASAALPSAITAPPQPAPPPVQYEPRAQAVDQADGDPVVRPPMPVR
jgi:hypothetical protein